MRNRRTDWPSLAAKLPVGLVTKHGILIVEFSSQLRDEGKEMFTAVTESASPRLCPIPS
jgi:multidrug efflux pump subunit AcrB